MAGECLPSPDIQESAATFGKKMQRFLQTALPLFPESLAAPTEKRRGFLPDAAGPARPEKGEYRKKWGVEGGENRYFWVFRRGRKGRYFATDNQTTLRRL